MATSASAWVYIGLKAWTAPSSPHEGNPVLDRVENVAGGERWTHGAGSGQIGKAYRKSGTLGVSATDAFNLLAAGALTDVYGQTIDADELKAIVVRCVTGSIRFLATAGTPLGCFGAAGDYLTLAAGHTLGLSFGATGLDVTTNSLFSITDGGAGSTYELELIVAE